MKALAVGGIADHCHILTRLTALGFICATN
jgi:hypothetical protein